MEYDIVIIGAGIAGSGLAFNLSQLGYKGKVIVIDKGLRGNDYGYRYTSKRVISEYGFGVDINYTSYSLGANGVEVGKIRSNVLSFDYKKECEKLLDKSDASLLEDEVVDLGKNYILTRSKLKIKFKYLVDATGINHFAKRKLKHKIPRSFFRGITYELKGRRRQKGDFLTMFYENGSLEELYSYGGNTLYGSWVYITPDKEKLYPPYVLRDEVKHEYGLSVIPVEPAFPFISGNIVFLGDSCGQALPGSGVGIEPILFSSKMLANCFLRDRVDLYQKMWKKRFLKKYMSQLSYRNIRYSKKGIWKDWTKVDDLIPCLANNQPLFNALFDMFKEPSPKKILDIFPLGMKIELFYDFVRRYSTSVFK